MNRRILFRIIALMLSLIVFAFVVRIFLLRPADFDRPVPILLFTAKISSVNAPMIDNEYWSYPKSYTNVTQGKDLKINVTVTSNGYEETVFIRDIRVWWYNSKINFYTWEDPPIGNGSIIQARAFNYTSIPNPINLQPNKSNSTIITLNIAKDAPLGQYSMDVDLEAIIITPLPNSFFYPTGSCSFFIIINPS